MSETPETPKPAGASPAEILANLKRQEATSGRSGAIPRMPKQHMLDASEVQAKKPEKHLRWVSLKDSNKVPTRKHEGYVVVPEKDGGRTLGDEYVLMEIPKERYEQRLAQQREENDRRLNQHDKEWQQQAEAVARELRDKHGIRIKPEHLTKA